MRLTRRTFLRSGIAAALWTSARNGRADPAPAALPLAAGPVDLMLLGDGPVTRALGYSGASPGPLLRAKAGGRLEIAFQNTLSEATSLAFPGPRGPRNQLCFGALGDAAIAAAASRKIVLQANDPGFQIYGALLGPDPALQMARGLFGPLVVDEPTPPQIDLETIVLLSEWRLDAQGQIALPSPAGNGERLILTAGGSPAPLQLTGPPGGRVRLRLGNCATARTLLVSIEGVKPLIVAVDGQPSAPFEPLRNLLPVGAGARFELMFDLPRDGGAARFRVREDDPAAPGEDLLIFSTVGAAAAERSAIAGFPENAALPKEIELERALRAEIVIAGGEKAPLTINGAAAPAKPLFSAPRKAPVALAFVNKTASQQTMRITGHVARLLHSLDDGWDPYWRDVFIVPAGKTIHAAFVADNPGLWPLESTSPERRNSGLMGVFAVS